MNIKIILQNIFIFSFIISIFYSSNNKNNLSSSSSNLFLSNSDNCTIIGKSLFNNNNNNWTLIIKMQINNQLIENYDFINKHKIIWKDHIGIHKLDFDSLQQLPPVKVKILLDTENEILYNSKNDYLLNSLDLVRREKKFWHALAKSLVQALTLAQPLGDMVMVYHISSEHGDPSPVCTDKSCTDSISGVLHSILDTITFAYQNKTLLSKRHQIKQIFEKDEWQQIEGEKVMIIIRWRYDPLNKSSYPFDDPDLKGKLFVITIDRIFNQPSKIDYVQEDIRKRYKAEFIYVSAPPAEDISTNTKEEELSKLIKEYLSHQRSFLGINIQFPYLLDEKTAENGLLQIEGICSISDNLESDHLKIENELSKVSKVSNEIFIGKYLAVSCIIFQVILILFIFSYKFSPSYREKIERILTVLREE